MGRKAPEPTQQVGRILRDKWSGSEYVTEWTPELMVEVGGPGISPVVYGGRRQCKTEPAGGLGCFGMVREDEGSWWPLGVFWGSKGHLPD